MKVVLYARVSTTRQAEKDLSIPDQIQQMKQYCGQNGHEVAKIFREEGASATDDNRPRFQEMLGYVLDRGTGVEAILVLTTSRFFRDALGALIYKQKLKKAGIRVISITQEVSEDPRGRSTCKGNRIPEADLDSQILKYLFQKFFTRERIREIIIHVNRELTNRCNQNSRRLKELRAELDGVRMRICKHYEAIESGALELGLVSERLRELKEWESEISRQLKRFQGPKQLPPYLFKDETLRKIQARFDEISMSNERGMAKEYLKFFLDRIEVNGRNINLVANTVALCNFSLIKNRGNHGCVNRTSPSCPVMPPTSMEDSDRACSDAAG